MSTVRDGLLIAVLALTVVGCQETIHHATMAPEVLDFGVIDIGGDESLDLTLASLVDHEVYVYFLAPETFAADLVPAGDDMGDPFEFGEEPIVVGAGDGITLGVQYTCWAQDRGSFRWEVTAMSSLEASGYWNATRDVGTLVLKGSCGSDDD